MMSKHEEQNVHYIFWEDYWKLSIDTTRNWAQFYVLSYREGVTESGIVLVQEKYVFSSSI
jgi:hypothetical protein